MLRRVQCRLLRFEQLLCGEAAHIVAQPPHHTVAALPAVTDELDTHVCDAAARRFRLLAGPVAPLPVRLTALTAATLLREGRCGDAVRCAAAHPHCGEVMRCLATVLYASPHVSADCVWGLVDELRRSGVAGTVDILTAMARHYARDGGTGGDATSSLTRLRQTMLQYIDYDPRTAAALLRPLCLVSLHCTRGDARDAATWPLQPSSSPPTSSSLSSLSPPSPATATVAEHNSCAPTEACALCDEVLRVVQLALRDARMDAADVGYVLELLVHCPHPVTHMTPQPASSSSSPTATVTATMAPAAQDEQQARAVAGAETRHKHYCRKAVALWGWAQHTAACCDVRAVSAVVLAYAALRRLDDAVACVQRLSGCGGGEVNTRAQAAVVTLCGSSHPPLCRYADQLVAHWQPDVRRLWCDVRCDGENGSGEGGGGGAQAVARALLVLHTRCRNDARLLELMTQAYAVLRTCANACTVTLLQSPDMPYVLLRCLHAYMMTGAGSEHTEATRATTAATDTMPTTATGAHAGDNADVTTTTTTVTAMIADMLLARILALPNLAAHPLLLAVAIHTAQHLRRLHDVWVVLDTLQLSHDAAMTLLYFLAEQQPGMHKPTVAAAAATTTTTTTAPHTLAREAAAARLTLLNDVAAHLRCDVPADVRMWLDLLQ